MAGFNRVILMGNLTRDPELRYTPQGTAVSDLRLAVTTSRGRGAERRDDTVFIDVTVWERQAETCSEYLSKGRAVLVEGRLKLDEWDDRETGQKRSKLSVVASSVTFVGGRDSGGEVGGSAAPRRREAQEPAKQDEGLDSDFKAADDVPF